MLQGIKDCDKVVRKTMGQRYFCGLWGDNQWDRLTPDQKKLWEDNAKKLAKDFDTIRVANKVVIDEQTDDNPGVPVNDYS